MLFFDTGVFEDILAAFLSVLMHSYQAGYNRTSECNKSKVHRYRDTDI